MTDQHDAMSSPGPGAEHHIVPVRVLAGVLLALLGLTFATVAVTWSAKLDFGRAGNLWIALTIATVKATLVVLYFMHVRYAKPIVGIILLSALAFVLLFAGGTLMDTHAYQPDIEEYRAVDPNARYAPAIQLQ